jgi:hypothetical protein
MASKKITTQPDKATLHYKIFSVRNGKLGPFYQRIYQNSSFYQKSGKLNFGLLQFNSRFTKWQFARVFGESAPFCHPIYQILMRTQTEDEIYQSFGIL